MSMCSNNSFIGRHKFMSIYLTMSLSGGNKFMSMAQITVQ